ncbi:unnamed protein product, partial [Ectocarpus sp. 12 AP-2014]
RELALTQDLHPPVVPGAVAASERERETKEIRPSSLPKLWLVGRYQYLDQFAVFSHNKRRTKRGRNVWGALLSLFRLGHRPHTRTLALDLSSWRTHDFAAEQNVRDNDRSALLLLSSLIVWSWPCVAILLQRQVSRWLAYSGVQELTSR